MELTLGNQIKELRKQKNMTQEQLAEALGLTAQSVSKWETGLGYPDMTLIPILANIFGVSLDTLFGYDTAKLDEKIEAIIKEAKPYFWDEPLRTEEILKTALVQYPNHEKLLRELLSLYECQLRTNHKTEYYEPAIAIGEKLIAEAEDIFVVCSAKADMASIHLLNGRYEKAKNLIDSLPYMYPYLLNDKMRTSAYMLKGEDRLREAKDWKTIEIQELYIACSEEGQGYYEVGEYEKALVSFTQYQKIIEMFMKKDECSPDAYLWAGMQTHHWCSYLDQAGCLLKLGRKDEIQTKIDRAYEIIEHAWGEEFEKKREYFMEPFRETYREMGLDVIALCK